MSKLISNYLFTVMYQVLLMLTPVITTPYISRVLKAEGVGIEAYVASIVQLFIVFIVFSLPMYGSRQIAVQQDEKSRSKEFWSIYSFQFFLAILNFIVFFFFIGTVDTYKVLFLINALTLLAYSIDISWYFIGKEEMKKIAIRNMVVKIAGIILIFSFVKDIDDLPLYIAINGGTLLLGQFIMWIPLFKEISFIKVSFQDIKKHVSPLIVLFVPQLMIQVYVLVNKIILGNISGEIEVGYYNQANKIIKIVLGVISSLGMVLLPRMATEFAKGNETGMRRYIDNTLQFVLMVTLPMMFGLMAITPNFVVWFFGDEFIPVISVLTWMSPVIFFVGLANVFGIQILVATNQQNKYSISITIGAILSLIANFVLVHSLESLATTIALLIAEAVGALIQMYYARKFFNIKPFLIMFIKYFILSGFVYLSARIIGTIIDATPILLTLYQLIGGVSIYVCFLFIFKDPLLIKVLSQLIRKHRAKR